MTDILLPLNLRQAQTSIRYIDSVGISRGLYTGALKTAIRGGDRLGASIRFTSHGGNPAEERSSRAILRSFLASLRGRANRAFLTDTSYRRRGVMPTGELLPSSAFENGTTGFSALSPVSGMTVQDRVLRVYRIANNGSAAAFVHNTSGISLTQYAPYVLRAMTIPGRNSSVMYPVIGAGTTAGSSTDGGSASSTSFGMLTAAFIAQSSSPYFAGVGDFLGIGPQTDDDLFCSYLSLARCVYVDGGGNLLQRSDEMQSAPWSTATGGSIVTNQQTAPDGTVTSDRFTEDATTGLHYLKQTITVSSGAGDYCQYGYFKPGSRTACWMTLHHAGGDLIAYFTLTSTGAVQSSSAGTGWSNVRAFVQTVGSTGWYRCYLVGRKTGSYASIDAQFGIANPSGTASYTGTNSLAAMDFWRFGVNQGGLPSRPTQSTTAAVAAESQAGSAIYTKGWPISTSNLLLVDDQVEIITSLGSELKILTAPVNSDAGGLAYMQFEPPLRGTLTDNAPIIIHRPMGRFIYTGESVGWDNDAGFFSSASCDFEEACGL